MELIKQRDSLESATENSKILNSENAKKGADEVAGNSKIPA